MPIFAAHDAVARALNLVFNKSNGSRIQVVWSLVQDMLLGIDIVDLDNQRLIRDALLEGIPPFFYAIRRDTKVCEEKKCLEMEV
jgi:hypothetical protein